MKTLAILVAVLGDLSTPAHAGGWYLMAPPEQNIKPELNAPVMALRKPDLKAPLTAWKIEGSFDAAKDCERERKDHFATVNEQCLHTVEDQKADSDFCVARPFAANARCVATDDPRLAR